MQQLTVHPLLAFTRLHVCMYAQLPSAPAHPHLPPRDSTPQAGPPSCSSPLLSCTTPPGRIFEENVMRMRTYQGRFVHKWEGRAKRGRGEGDRAGSAGPMSQKARPAPASRLPRPALAPLHVSG